jgi:hypothetical protein
LYCTASSAELKYAGSVRLSKARNRELTSWSGCETSLVSKGGLGYRSTASPAGADTEVDWAFAIAIYLAEARLVKANPLKPVVALEVEEPKASRW